MQIEKWFNTDNIKRFYFPGRIFVGLGVFDHAVTMCRDIEGGLAIVVDRVFVDQPAVASALKMLESNTVGIKVISGSPIAQEVIEFAQELGDGPGGILAIGGGSVTDFAKAVASHFMFGSIDGIGLGGVVPNQQKAKPLLISVPTTAGSGAEASRYFVTYDRHDHHKMFGKSWGLIADWIMLDPIFLETMPEDILVACAFDAFVHLFETLACQHERSWFGDMFSVAGIAEILDALNRAIYQGDRGSDVHASLMQAATLGGVAISNVRTGNIHEAAGALLELTKLSHPETLYVFFREAVEQYQDAIAGRTAALLAQLRLVPGFEKFTELDDIIGWWEAVFQKVGLDQKVRAEAAACVHPINRVREHVFHRVFSDKVWINKESPVVLDESAILQMIDRSFARFGFDGAAG